MTVSLVTITGCKSDDDGGNGGGAASGTIEANIDGAAFTSLELTSIATLANGNLIIQGNDADGKSVVMTIFAYDGEGTYEFTGVDPLILHTASYIEADINNPANTQSWLAPFDGTLAGSVSISNETSDSIEGTFEFTGKNANDMSMVDVTMGSFNLSKQTL
ncbi:MAG: hypothetical protein HKN54_01850 [Flavobacteriaceae bacterium]|nr:hypothetical protein [Flavobacteriaceae bacterium]